jgi:hypothetical protein
MANGLNVEQVASLAQANLRLRLRSYERSIESLLADFENECGVLCRSVDISRWAKGQYKAIIRVAPLPVVLAGSPE